MSRAKGPCTALALVVLSPAAHALADPAPSALPLVTGDILTIAYVGTLFAIVLYNLLLHTATRDRGYLKFALFAAAMAFGQLGLSGLGERLVWRSNEIWVVAAAPMGFAVAGLAAALYTREFLHSPTRAPSLDRLIQAMAWIFATIAVGAVILPGSGTTLVGVAAPAFGLLALVTGLRCRRLRAPGAAYYVAGWAAMLGGAAALGARDLNSGTLPSWFQGTFPLTAMQLATALGTLLLSFALAERTGAMWRERAVQQGEMLSSYEHQIEALKSEEARLTHRLTQHNDEIDELVLRLQDSEQRALDAAHLDPVTGLVNQLLLADRINQGIIRSKRHNTRVATIMIDLDQFRPLRESLGADAADTLLCEVATRLRAVVREQDTIARVEHDQFVIVLEEIFDAEDLQRVANSISDSFKEDFRLGAHRLNVSASLGCAIYPDGGQSATALIKQAAKLMRRAKEGKRRNREHGRDAGSVAA